MIKVGLDYHTSKSYVSIFKDDEEIMHGEVDSQASLADLLSSFEDPQVLFEAGYGWPRLVRLLEDSDVELEMCHPHHNRAIATDRRKSDRRDAHHLAMCLKTGSYKSVYMPDAEVREERQLVRSRMNLRRRITQSKNQVHSLLAYAGVPKEKGNIFTRKKREYLEAVELPDLTRNALNILLEMLDRDTDLLKRFDDLIATLNKRDPRARLLKTIPGVGNYTARVLLTEIGEVGRFNTDKSLACYAGLAPGLRQSGKTKQMKGITKEGSARVRSVIVEAAWIAIRTDPYLKDFYHRLKEKSNCSGIAICAVARKLIVAVFHILTKNTPYRPTKPVRRSKSEEPRGKLVACRQ